jgi:DNA invertase Pin-like site-specific DNA recombinase
MYARYSTEEQDESSIPDQFAYCRRYLETLGYDLKLLVIDEFSDPETSGERVSRPGIDRVADGIEQRKWDLLICEDTSRLFRNSTACCELVETAYDMRMRVIAINDDVDTDEEGWEDRLHEAANHHAKANRYTSSRIKRKLTSLWHSGAAIGLLKPGYRRNRPAEEFVGQGRRRRKKTQIRRNRT